MTKTGKKEKQFPYLNLWTLIIHKTTIDGDATSCSRRGGSRGPSGGRYWCLMVKVYDGGVAVEWKNNQYFGLREYQTLSL